MEKWTQIGLCRLHATKTRYKNGAVGLDTNVDDVLQIANVSKGESAKSQDLQQAFGTTDLDTIVKEVSAMSTRATNLSVRV